MFVQPGEDNTITDAVPQYRFHSVGIVSSASQYHYFRKHCFI